MSKKTPELTIADLAKVLQTKVDEKLKEFSALQLNIRSIERELYKIALDLQPVESLIASQNPELGKLFNYLKDAYGKESDSVQAEQEDRVPRSEAGQGNEPHVEEVC